MSKKNKNKKQIPSTPAQTSDRTIDSIIEETRFLSEQEKMEKEAAKLSGGPKMEEIYSNKSKEVRLTNQSPLDVASDDDEQDITEQETADSEAAPAQEDTPREEQVDVDVKLAPEFDEGTKVAKDIIEDVDGFNFKSIGMKDIEGIDIDLDDPEPEAGDTPQDEGSKTNQNDKENESLSSFERLFGKPRPVGAVQTVVSKVPVYQHESKVDKVHVRAGKFSAVVETEYKKYIASPNPVISQNLKPEPEKISDEETDKPTPQKIASGVAGKVMGFFSSHEDDDNDNFKEKTIQIEDYRSQQDVKSIMMEVNSNIRKMFINSIFTGGIFILSLILTIVGRVITHSFTSALVLSLLNLILLFGAGWICRVTIINGISPLKKFKGNSDTGAAVAAVATALQCITAMFIPTAFFGGNKYLYTTIAVLALSLNCLGKLFMVLRVKDNFRFVSSKNSAAYCAKIYTNEDIAHQLVSGTAQGKPIVAYQHQTEFMSDFLRLSYSPDPSEDMASKISPVTILCSLFVSVMYAIFSKDIWGAFSALAVMTCISAPLCDLLAVNLPLRKLCKDSLSKNAMISGYPAVRQFCDTKAVICQAQDLYPIDSITLNGVKAFSNHKLEDGMLAAAAVLKEAKNPMACIFDHVVADSKDKLPKVESILYEDRLGLVGWVNGDRILFGNRALLDKYAITPPSEEFEEKQKKEGRVVNYLVRSNELLAMFVTTYDTTLRIAEQLQRAEASGISLLVHTTDCNVTGEKIAADFGIFYRSVKVLPTGLGNVCQEITSAKEDSSRAYLATRGSFLSFLRAVTGCVRLRNNVSIAVILQLMGIIIGILLVSTIALFAGVSALKNIELLIFSAFWAIASIAAPAFQKP